MKNLPFRTLIIVAGAFALPACTMDGPGEVTTASSEAHQCFFPSEVSGFSNAGENQIYVDTGPSETYLFTTFGGCPDLDFTQKIALEQVGGGTICSGLDVNLIVPTVIGPRKCQVRMIRRLSDAEVKARGL